MRDKISIRSFDVESDYPTITKWWSDRGSPVQSSDLLPSTGFIVRGAQEDLCAGFLFKTDARIAVIGHVVSNPNAKDKEARSGAIDALISRLIDEASLCGFRVVTASSNVPRLNQRYEDMGFVKSDENETHYGRVLECLCG